MSISTRSAVYAIATTTFLWGGLMVLDDPVKLVDVAEGSLAVLALAAILVGLVG